MKPLLYLTLSLSLLTACKKKEEPQPRETPTAGSAGSAGSAGATAGSAAAPVDAGPSPAERVTEGMKKADADAEAEKTRWTPEIEKAALAVRDGKYKDTKEALEAILKSPHRMPKHGERDAARHPVETLTFFGIQPTSTVVELGAGGGWYTELLAPLLHAKGKLIVAGPPSSGGAEDMTTVYGKRLDQFLAKSPELFGKVQRVEITPPDKLELGPAGTADHVIAIREIHNWTRRGFLEKYLAAVHAVLKDGGTFGIVAHRGKPDAKPEDSAEKGYLPEQWVIDNVTKAGFELVEKSEVNANPKDTKDYEKGVWTLPPNYREGDKDREKYAAIGESDRMTLRFKKVAKK